MLGSDHLTPIYEAAVQAAEEAIVNALIAARTMTGIDGLTPFYAPPHDRLQGHIEKVQYSATIFFDPRSRERNTTWLLKNSPGNIRRPCRVAANGMPISYRSSRGTSFTGRNAAIPAETRRGHRAACRRAGVWVQR